MIRIILKLVVHAAFSSAGKHKVQRGPDIPAPDAGSVRVENSWSQAVVTRYEVYDGLVMPNVPVPGSNFFDTTCLTTRWISAQVGSNTAASFGNLGVVAREVGNIRPPHR